ncbi:hypothetical protein GCM10027039_24520 [Terrabacter koreensis]
MSTFERRVSELLRGYGEGLEMTTQDVNRLEQELEQKRAAKQAQSRGRRNRIFQAAVAACAVTGVVLGALALRSGPEPTPAPAATPTASSDLAPTPTMTDLAGIWREEPKPGQDPTGWLWTFRTGALAIDGGPNDLFLPSATHRLSLVPDGFTTIDTEAPECTTRFSAAVTDEGRMRATVVTSTPTQGRLCNLAKGDFWDLTRISPKSPASEVLSSVWAARATTPVQGLGDLAGTWLLKGTGRVLTITAAGAYEVRDPAAADRNRKGRLSVAPDGRVTATAADDPKCTAVYRPITTPYNAFDAVLVGGGCARLGRAGDQWIRLN